MLTCTAMQHPLFAAEPSLVPMQLSRLVLLPKSWRMHCKSVQLQPGPTVARKEVDQPCKGQLKSLCWQHRTSMEQPMQLQQESQYALSPMRSGEATYRLRSCNCNEKRRLCSTALYLRGSTGVFPRSRPSCALHSTACFVDSVTHNQNEST